MFKILEILVDVVKNSKYSGSPDISYFGSCFFPGLECIICNFNSLINIVSIHIRNRSNDFAIGRIRYYVEAIGIINMQTLNEFTVTFFRGHVRVREYANP